MRKIFGILLVVTLLAGVVFYTSCKKNVDISLLGNISGLVKTASGNVVENAIVSISPGNLSTSTDGSGKYSYSNLEPKTYAVTITKPGYSVKTMNITVIAGETAQGDATLLSQGSIAGTVTNAQTNQPVQGVSVTLSPGNSTTNTGNDGKYSFNSLEPKDYTIQVQKTGFASNTKTVTVADGQTTQGDISIAPVAASLSVNLTSLDFGSNLTTLPFEIRNSGAGTLTWNVVENINWLAVNPISGTTTTEADPVVVTIDRTGLSQGTYTQMISVTSDGGIATISISLTIANPNAPTVTCANAINISQATAEVSGEITSIGSSNVTQRGHCWSTTPNPTTSNNITTLGPTSATGSYTSQLAGLMANTTYYVRAYATNNNGTGYSTDQVFTTTSSPTVPTMTTDAANNITQTTADISGAISNLGSGGITQHGHCWSTSSSPTTSSYKTTLGTTTSTGSYLSNLTNLAPNTTYYVKSYAVNSAGTGYSNEVSFTTTSNPTSPTVTTGSVTSITMSDASVEGNISSTGTSNVTQHGHCWSMNMNPTTSDTKTQLGSAVVGSYTSNMTGLSANTTYYVRAYATNSAGTSYGSQQTFATASPNVPTVTTSSISAITGNSATGGGNVASDGGASVTTRGVCWSTSQNPTTSNSVSASGYGTGSFSCSLNGLDPMTTYYVRAYATNSSGTGYGNQISFTTIHNIGEAFGGGVIFYLDGTGLHGLIAATTDQASDNNIEWGCNGTSTGANGTAIGTGMQNTNLIISICTTSGIAARLCSDLVLNGYSDWYLPSKDELTLMVSKASMINMSTTCCHWYWSSSEVDASAAWMVISFSGGGSQQSIKTASASWVRAIRSF